MRSKYPRMAAAIAATAIFIAVLAGCSSNSNNEDEKSDTYTCSQASESGIESAENKVGNLAEKLMLYCYHYDPSTGKYGLAVMNVMRLGGIATLIGIGAMLFVFWRRGKRKEGDQSVA